jgi:hypothetical protein
MTIGDAAEGMGTLRYRCSGPTIGPVLLAEMYRPVGAAAGSGVPGMCLVGGKGGALLPITVFLAVKVVGEAVLALWDRALVGLDCVGARRSRRSSAFW